MSEASWKSFKELNMDNRNIEYVISINETTLLLIEWNEYLSNMGTRQNTLKNEVLFHKYNIQTNELILSNTKYKKFNRKWTKIYYDKSSNSLYCLIHGEFHLTKYNLTTNKWEYINKSIKIDWGSS